MSKKINICSLNIKSAQFLIYTFIAHRLCAVLLCVKIYNLYYLKIYHTWNKDITTKRHLLLKLWTIWFRFLKENKFSRYFLELMWINKWNVFVQSLTKRRSLWQLHQIYIFLQLFQLTDLNNNVAFLRINLNAALKLNSCDKRAF